MNSAKIKANRTWAKNAGKSVAFSSIQVLKTIMPNITGTASSTAEAARDLRDTVSAIKSNDVKKTARDIFDRAMADIKSGNFSIDKDGDDAFGSMDDFDFDFDSGFDSDDDSSDDYDPEEGNAKLGRAIVTGNVATIDAIKDMTSVVAKTQLKSAQMISAHSANIAIIGINKLNTGLINISSKLDTINDNLVSMIEFQNENISVTNQATLNYYDRSLEILERLDKNSNSGRKDKEYKSSPEFLMGGLNVGDYAKYVKKNFDSSMIGSIIGLGKTMSSMSGPINLPKMMLEEVVLPMLIPGKIKRGMGSLDKNFDKYMKSALYRIGDMKSDYSTNSNGFKRFIGELFGVSRETNRRASMGNFHKDVMGWNGEAQKTLTEVIPSYLSKMEAHLAIISRGSDAKVMSKQRFYDMDTGMFKDRKTVEAEYVSMNEWNKKGAVGNVLEKINTSLENDGATKTQIAELQNTINILLNKRINGEMSYDSEYRKGISKMAPYMDKSQFKQITSDLESAINDALENIANTRKDVEGQTAGSVYRNLFNEHGKEFKPAKMSNLFEDVFTPFYAETPQTMIQNIIDDLGPIDGIIHIESPFIRTFAKAMTRDADESTLKKMVVAEVNRQLKLDQTKKFKTKIFGSDRFSNNKFTTKAEEYMENADDLLFRAAYGSDKYGDDFDVPYKGWEARGKRWYEKNDDDLEQDRINSIIKQRRKANAKRVAGQGHYYTESNTPGAASSRATGSGRSNVPEPPKKKSNVGIHIPTTYKETMNKSLATIERENKWISRNIDDPDKEAKIAPNHGEVNNQTSQLAVIDNTMRNLDNTVVNMHASFGNIVSGIFGKEGVLGTQSTDKWVKGTLEVVKEQLFNEKDGIFNEITKTFLDVGDYMKYSFTGKGYTNRKGEKLEESENAVFKYLKKGYGFTLGNTMKFIFGEDYESNATYNKYFAWMGGKKSKKSSADAMAKKKAEDQKIQSETGRNTIVMGGESEAALETGNLLGLPTSTKKAKTISMRVKTKDGKTKVKQIPLTNTAEIHEAAEENLINSTASLATQVNTSSNAIAKITMGENKTEKQAEKSFFQKFKENLPKSLTAGIVGAGAGLLGSMGGMGMLGLFLPGGPVGGAIVGMGAQLLSKSKIFQEFMFGKLDEKTGKKTGGLISQKMKDSFKKALPKIIGGATLGALKGIIFPRHTMVGPTGVLLNTILPGGPIGGAVLGLAGGLIFNNEKFRKILFGEKDTDGKRMGGMLSKGMNGFKSTLTKFLPHIKNGAMGLGAGLLTGTVISKMGLLGAAATAGGPIGMGIAGLGIGIASQTETFKKFLFGDELLDMDGNPTGKRNKNGLLQNVQDTLRVNIFQPVKESIEGNMSDFAHWARLQLLLPFKKAFDPIVNKFKDVGDYIKDKIDAVAKAVTGGIGKFFKSIFKPVTNVIGKVLSGMVSGISKGIKLALLPARAAVGVVNLLTSPKRNLRDMQFNVQNAAGTYQGLKAKWANNEEAGEGQNVFGKLNDIRKAYTGKEAKEAKMEAHRSWAAEMRSKFKSVNDWDLAAKVQEERTASRADKNKTKMMNKAYAYGHKLYNKENINESTLLTDRKIKTIRQKLLDIGLEDKGLSNERDIKDFIMHRDDWSDKYGYTAKEAKEATVEADGTKSEETPEAKEARIKTDGYQTNVAEHLDDIKSTINKLYNKFFGEPAEEGPFAKKGKRFKIKSKVAENGTTVDEDDAEPSSDPEVFEKMNDALQSMAEGTFGGLYKRNKRRPNQMHRAMNKQAIDAAYTSPQETGEATSAVIENLFGVSEKRRYKIKSRESRNSREAKESAEARSLGGIFSTDQESAEERNMLNLENNTRKKKGVIGTIGDGVKNVFGSISGFIGKHSNIFKALGITVAIGAIFKDQIKNFFSSAWNVMSENAPWFTSGVSSFWNDKAIPWMKETVQPFITDTIPKFIGETVPGLITTGVSNMADFISKHGSEVINTVTGLITPLVPAIGNAIITLGGAAFKWAFDKMTGNEGKVLTPEEAAIAQANGIGVNTMNDGTLYQGGDREYYDDYNNKRSVTSNVPSQIGRLAANNILNPSLLPKTAKLFGKAAAATVTTAGVMAAGPIGLLPLGITKLFSKGVKGATKVISHGVDAAGNAAAKTMTSEAIEAAAKAAGDTAAKAAGKAAGKGAKGSKAARKAAKLAAETAARESAEKAVKEASESTIKKLLSSAQTGLASIINNPKIIKIVSKLPGVKVMDSFVRTFNSWIAKALTKIASSSNFVLQKLAAKTSTALAEATAKSTAGIATAGIVTGFFAAYDIVTGAFEANRLFNVSSDDVTIPMGVISSIFKCILGLGPAPIIDCAMEIIGSLVGVDVKCEIATGTYKLISNDADDKIIEQSQKAMELEAKLYNKDHNTNLDINAYSELKDKGVAGSVWNGIKNIVGAGDKTDYSKYEREAKAQVADTYHGDGGRAPASIKNVTNSSLRRTGDSYYGSASQKDPRWAGYRLGTLPNGAPSTMENGGCGPTALSTVASQYNINSNPLSVAKFAKTNGYISNGGSTTDLFTSGAQKLGLKASRVPSTSIESRLASGKPMILSGRDSSGKSPFTSAGHIVTATGTDGNGNVIVSDPKSGGKRAYSLDSVKRGMTNAWQYDKTSPRGRNSRKSNKPIGYGPYRNYLSSPTAAIPAPHGPYQNYLSIRNAEVANTRLLKYQVGNPYWAAKYDGIYTKRNIKDLQMYQGGVYYSATDPEWANIVYDGHKLSENVRSSSEIISLAMMLSTATNSGITPAYLVKEIIPTLSAMKSRAVTQTTGTLKWDSIFDSHNGIQTLESIIGQGKSKSPFGVTKVGNVQDMITNALLGKLTLLEGAPYKGSIFGDGINKTSLDKATLAGGRNIRFSTYGDQNALAYSDPWNVDFSKNAVISPSVLSQLVGKTKQTVYGANSYAITPSDNSKYDKNAVKKLLTNTKSYGDMSNDAPEPSGFASKATGFISGIGSMIKNISKIAAFHMENPGVNLYNADGNLKPEYANFFNENVDAGTLPDGTVLDMSNRRVNANPQIASAQQSILTAMFSRQEKNNYDQSLRHLQGSSASDCSSMVDWATGYALGMNGYSDTGHKGSPGSSTQYTMGTPVDRESAHSGPNEANLQIGDYLFYKWPTDKDTKATSHVEMYAGNDTLIGHGRDKGPFTKSMSKYNPKSYIGASRIVNAGNTSKFAGKIPEGWVTPLNGTSDPSDTSSYYQFNGAPFKTGKFSTENKLMTPDLFFKNRATLGYGDAYYGPGDEENLSVFDKLKNFKSGFETLKSKLMGTYQEPMNETTSGGMDTGSYSESPKRKMSTSEFMDKVLQGAMVGYRDYNILPSLTLSQAALESGWGKSAIGHNLFGIKAGKNWKGKRRNVRTREEDANGKSYYINADFRDYDSYEESVLDHSKLLLNSRYDRVRQATNYKDATQMVKECGYATAHNYPQVLQDLIRQNGWDYFDNKANKNAIKQQYKVYYGDGASPAKMHVNHNYNTSNYTSKAFSSKDNELSRNLGRSNRHNITEYDGRELESYFGDGDSSMSTQSRRAIEEKFNIAFSTDGVENKLNVLIGIVKQWYEVDKNKSSINVNNNMTRAQLNNASKTPDKTNTSYDGSADNNLRSIHDRIASGRR